MELRPYQRTCINAVNQYLRSSAGHPVVSIPTAGGKTIIFGTMIREWLEAWPGSRVCILAHRQELLTQAEDKIKTIWPEAPISVYSAGLKRRELTEDILIAGIQSIYKRADEVRPLDIAIVDECHLLGPSAETMYRAFIDDLLDLNPALRVIGWTATPYRLDGGELAGPEEEKLFDHVCYEANINELIRDGYLCELKTKATDVRLDATGIHTRQGDFVQGEMDRRFSNRGIVEKAVEEIVQKADSRKSWLVFCCGVDHAKAVLHEIRSYGVDAELVIGKTHKEDRGDILQRFDSGDLRCIVNVNCLTTGLDVTRIDMIAMLRPTQSTSLWVQAVGRGFRLHPGVKDTLVLDFGENCYRHGPINNIQIKKKGIGGGDGGAPIKTCPKCKEYVMAGVKECPECGHQFPEREVSHLSKASEAQILANAMDAPATIDVDYVSVRRHTKAGKPDSVRVSYHCGLNVYSEWICFDHGGYAAEKARYWWMRRFSSEDRPPVPEATEEALHTLLRMNNGVSPINSRGSPNYHHDLSSMTRSIKIQRQGKYMQVLQVHLDNERRTAKNV